MGLSGCFDVPLRKTGFRLARGNDDDDWIAIVCRLPAAYCLRPTAVPTVNFDCARIDSEPCGALAL